MRKIQKGDTVQIMIGKDAGKQGKVVKVVMTKDGITEKVVVEGMNKVKKSQKPNPQLGIEGGVIEFEKPVNISNVMLVDPKTNEPTRVGITIDKKTGKRNRVTKKSGTVLDK